MTRYVPAMDPGSLIVGGILTLVGAVASWFGNHFYYVKALRQSAEAEKHARAQVADLQEQVAVALRAIEQISRGESVEYARDAGGKITGMMIRLSVAESLRAMDATDASLAPGSPSARGSTGDLTVGASPKPKT